jgi:hypothetical protein
VAHHRGRGRDRRQRVGDAPEECRRVVRHHRAPRRARRADAKSGRHAFRAGNEGVPSAAAGMLRAARNGSPIGTRDSRDFAPDHAASRTATPRPPCSSPRRRASPGAHPSG